jgi:hypothetical protein
LKKENNKPYIFIQNNKEKFFFLIEKKNEFNFIKYLFKKFFKDKGINITNINNKLINLQIGFELDENYFIQVKKNKRINLSYSKNEEKKQKLLLKQLVKRHTNQNINSLIKYLNKRINFWKQKFILLNINKNISKKLDIYLNKLLWKRVKRIHPRRPNTWIYNKYWKYILGTWKFSILDERGRFNTLTSYQSNNVINTFNRLPYSFISLEIYDLRKLLSIYFKFFKNKNFGIKNIMYNKQKGLCYKCKFPLNNSKKKIIRIKKPMLINKKLIYSQKIILNHNSCTI